MAVTVHDAVGPGDVALLRATLIGAEEPLMNLVLEYAVRLGYSRFTSTLLEAWRQSIVGLTDSVLTALDTATAVPDLDVDLDPVADPLAAFGIEEARRHRRRGVNLAMFLGLFKYYRRSYHQVLAGIPFDDPDTIARFVDAVFDRTELGYTSEWAGTSAETQIHELSAANLAATNDKTRLLTVFDGLPVPALLVGLDGSVQLVNGLAAALFGHTASAGNAHYGPDVASRLDLAWLRAWLAEDADADSGEREVDLDTPVGPRTYVCSLQRLADVSRRNTGYAVVLLDVTEVREHAQWLAEARAARSEVSRLLADRERLFRLVFRSAPTGMALIGAGAHGNGRILQVNPALETILGCEAADVLARPHDDWLHPEDRAASASAVVAAAAGERPAPVRLRYVAADGRITPTLAHTVAVRDADGEVDYVLRQVQDRADAERAEEELSRARTLEAVGELASGIAHEINTPIQFIHTNLDFLRRAADAIAAAVPAEAMTGPGGDDVAFFLSELPTAVDQSIEGVDRVATIVRAMRQFGHLDSADPEPTNLSDLVASVVTLTRNQTKHVAEVTIDVPEDMAPLVCYPGSLRQALTNLIVNAAHAVAARGPDGDRGTIRVQATTIGDEVVLSVSDSGVGIPPALRERVFEPFFTTKPVGEGTGQGLPLVRSVVVDKHGGRVTLASEPGVGTSFTLVLPSGGPAPR